MHPKQTFCNWLLGGLFPIFHCYKNSSSGFPDVTWNRIISWYPACPVGPVLGMVLVLVLRETRADRYKQPPLWRVSPWTPTNNTRTCPQGVTNSVLAPDEGGILIGEKWYLNVIDFHFSYMCEVRHLSYKQMLFKFPFLYKLCILVLYPFFTGLYFLISKSFLYIS